MRKSMKQIENEIVSFTARVEFDEATAKRVEESFNSIQQSANEARARIEKANAALMKMRMEGKEDTAEFKAMEAAMQADIKALKELNKQGDNYAKQLGVQKMSMKQLREHAKQLKKEMDGMHDTKRLAAYKKELKATEARIQEMGGGTKKTSSILSGAFGKVATKAGLIGLAVAGVAKVAKAAFKTALAASQSFGDKFGKIQAEMKAGWTQFIRDISTGQGFSMESIRNAAAAAAEAFEIRDEHFERNNSYMIQEVRMRKEINRLEAKAYDKSLSAKERLDALNEANEKEKQLAQMRADNQERLLKAAEKELSADTKLKGVQLEELEKLINEYQLNQDLIDQGKKYNALLDERQKLTDKLNAPQIGLVTSQQGWDNINSQRNAAKNRIEKINSELDKTPEKIIKIANLLDKYDLSNDEHITNYVQARTSVDKGAADQSEVDRANKRRESQLQQQMYSEDIARVEAWQTSRTNILKKQLLEQKITQDEYEKQTYDISLQALKRKENITRDYSKKIAGLDKQAATFASQALDARLARQKAETADVEKNSRERLNALKKQLLDGQITQEQYKDQSTAIETETLEAKKAILIKYGEDTTTIDSQILDKQLNVENRALEILSQEYEKQRLDLEKQLRNREITQEEYNARLRDINIAELIQEKAIREQYGEDTTALEKKILEARTELQEQYRQMTHASFKDIEKLYRQSGAVMGDAIKKYLTRVKTAITESDLKMTEEDLERLKRMVNSALTQNVSRQGQLDQNTRQFEIDMKELEDMYSLQLISEEEFQKRKQQIIRDYTQKNIDIQTKGWQNALSTATQMLDQMSQLVDTLQEAEFAAVEAWKQKELALAEGNSDRQAEIEEEAEAKKLEIQKKYADIDMGINIAKAIASGALAAVMAWTAAGGNPIIAGIFTALIAATTAAEVATIIAQRNAIKNTSSSSSASAPKTTGTVGFSEGGYTGPGERLEVAGVVHRGEYVVPQPQMRDPEVARMVASIESKRRRTSSKNALPGFAEGGYTDAKEESHYNELLSGIYDTLLTIATNPVPAYVVLSDLETKYDQQNRFKEATSLKYRKR